MTLPSHPTPLGAASMSAEQLLTAVSRLPPLPPALQPLPALVVKDGVGLGRLSPELRALALAVVWAGLPDGPMAEAEVNVALKAALNNAASFLDTDHVELRRWLVDSGWLQRDGFGREYRRSACTAVPPQAREVAQAARGLDMADCVRGWRMAEAQRRLERLQAFVARRAGKP
jgi:hypothetical protein